MATVGTDPQSLCVSPQNFEEHLAVIREHYRPLRFLDLAQPSARRTRGGIVITFDDGYRDNLLTAKPLLERYQVPATVFITTGYVGAHREFWWDELERLVLQPGTLPEELSLVVEGRTMRWQLGRCAEYSQDAYELARRWSVLDASNSHARHRVYRELALMLRPLDERRRDVVLSQLRTIAGVASEPRGTHRPLVAEEVRELARGPWIDVGAHSRTHPVLAALPEETQREEIACSKASLEEMTQRPVPAFSYPYGSIGDVSAGTVAEVRKAGYSCACLTAAGRVSRVTDALRLPRLMVRDHDGDRLRRALQTA